eukprot:CAMPEP_0178701854 /NCGR_PEP_ID=MMETSP0699-20121125/12532_1 /TAXON_ID=265572 /ORGANISM="Extubocellulus spinifer, Strain CCMP396" /LENGTH=215 /DNA_ID=CAMNT_0020348489 /DNA_START=224 /DNA_END=868 /DNA_ORIENTATION=-
MTSSPQHPRTIDASLPPPDTGTASCGPTTGTGIDTCQSSSSSSQLSLDLSRVRLPLPYEIIPANVLNLTECARHQIATLVQQAQQSAASAAANDTTTTTTTTPAYQLSESIADALDDGFVLCDLTVIQRKLLSWRSMFPRIKPFFAVKCHPDPMVSTVLGRCYPLECGYDCASLAEIRLALESMPEADRSSASGGGGGNNNSSNSGNSNSNSNSN